MTPTAPPSRPSPDAATPAQPLRIHDGDCWAFFAFDVGYAIDLDAAERLLAAERGVAVCREEIPHGSARRRAPASARFQPAPLRVDQPAPEAAAMDLGGFAPAPTVEVTLFDFGAVSVAYRIPLAGGESGMTLDRMLPLSQCLFECAPLRDDAARRVAALVSRLTGVGGAIDRANIAEIVEDYTVFHVRRWTGGGSRIGAEKRDAGQGAAADLSADRAAVARLLLAEPRDAPLSNQAVESALAVAVSYSDADAAVIDWNAALVLGADEADTLAVLEFANVELLEMRFLDDRLDAALDRSYATLLRRDARGRTPRSPLGFLFDPHRAERRRLAVFQMDSALLFEGVNNAIKLVGDQHLARIYAAAAKRFHLPEWDRSILRKQHTIDGLYQKLADEQANRRMEVLEWIIIILIAVSIVLPFLPWVGK